MFANPDAARVHDKAISVLRAAAVSTVHLLDASHELADRAVNDTDHDYEVRMTALRTAHAVAMDAALGLVEATKDICNALDAIERQTIDRIFADLATARDVDDGA